MKFKVSVLFLNFYRNLPLSSAVTNDKLQAGVLNMPKCVAFRDKIVNPESKKHKHKKDNISCARKFSCALSLTVKKYVSSLKFHMFKELYPKYYEYAPDELENIHNQLQRQLKSNIGEDLHKLCSKRNIIPLLCSLDRIIYKELENSMEQDEWRPSGDHVQDHLYLAKVDHKDKLKLRLQKMTSSNNERETIMYKNHVEILRLKENIRDLSQTLIESVDMLSYFAFSQRDNHTFPDSKNTLSDIVGHSDLKISV